MKLKAAVTLLLATWTGVFGLSLAVNAGDMGAVLVVGEDFGEARVSRFSRAFERVQEVVIEEFRKEGFDAFDEKKAANGNFRDEGLERRFQELKQVSASVPGANIQMAPILALSLDTDLRRYSKSLSFRVVGRAVDLENGGSLGEFGSKTLLVLTVPLDCSSPCLLENSSK